MTTPNYERYGVTLRTLAGVALEHYEATRPVRLAKIAATRDGLGENATWEEYTWLNTLRERTEAYTVPKHYAKIRGVVVDESFVVVEHGAFRTPVVNAAGVTTAHIPYARNEIAGLVIDFPALGGV